MRVLFCPFSSVVYMEEVFSSEFPILIKVEVQDNYA